MNPISYVLNYKFCFTYLIILHAYQVTCIMKLANLAVIKLKVNTLNHINLKTVTCVTQLHTLEVK